MKVHKPHIQAPAVIAVAVVLAFLIAGSLSPVPAEAATTSPEEAIIEGSIRVRGEGAAPSDRPLSGAQKRVLALRAAKVTAVREAAEILNGMTVTGDTTVMGAAVESDRVRSSVEGLIRGARIVERSYDPVSGVASAVVFIPLTGPDGVYARLLPGLAREVPFGEGGEFEPGPAPSGAGSHDGLIVRVRGEGFRPALANRVLSPGGGLVYGPSRADPAVIADRGAAMYTDTVENARSELEEQGSLNPLVVTADEVVRGTDVVVSAEDAARVFHSDRRGGFMSSARVVFVLE